MRPRIGIFALAAFSIGISTVACTASSPAEQHDNSVSLVDPVSNKIGITSRNEILWNGRPVTLATLSANLEQSRAFPVEPELQFVPEPQASYELSAKVLNVIRDSKVTKFGFVGNEKYRTFGGD